MDNVCPVLVYGPLAAVRTVRSEVWSDFALPGHAVGWVAPSDGAMDGYGCFCIALTRPVWPELKAVLDRVSWVQVRRLPPGAPQVDTARN